ncbi:MAG TPA: response regulator [Ktedonobacterales bacterium]
MTDDLSALPAAPVTVVYILDDDRAAGEALRGTLGALGYQVTALSDAAMTLAALRASEERAALFFAVEAYGETLDGQGYASLIGALLEDPALARRHVFAVISSSAEDVDWTLGKALARLNTPVFSKPCDAATLDAFLSVAHARPERQAPAVATL